LIIDLRANFDGDHDATQVVKKCHEIREHSHRIVSTTIVDDWRAFSAGADGKIVVFSLDSGEVLLEVRLLTIVCFALNLVPRSLSSAARNG